MKNKVSDVVVSATHCKGLVYEAQVGISINAKGSCVRKERFVLQKHLSCLGCAKCGQLKDMLNDYIQEGNFPVVEGYSINGCLYTLHVMNEQRHWESGFIKDWDLVFRSADGGF